MNWNSFIKPCPAAMALGMQFAPEFGLHGNQFDEQPPRETGAKADIITTVDTHCTACPHTVEKIKTELGIVAHSAINLFGEVTEIEGGVCRCKPCNG